MSKQTLEEKYAVEFDKYNNFCFKQGSLWVPFEDFERELSTAKKRIITLKEKLRIEKLVLEALKEIDKSTSPFCKHNAQYCYTEDGGKHIVCLVCETKAQQAQIAVLKAK